MPKDGLLPQQRRLAALVGEWEGESRTWFSPGDAPRESRWTTRRRPIMGGRFVLEEYSSSLDGDPFEGIVLYGWDLAEKKHFAVWVDTFHMSSGPMHSTGAEVPSALLNVIGTYKAGEQVWGWRTVIEVASPGEQVVTAYNISPAGQEDKAIETRLRRRKAAARGSRPARRAPPRRKARR